MEIRLGTVKGDTLEVTPAIHAYIEKKIGKLDKFVDSDDTSATADVEVGKIVPDQHSGDIFFAQVNLHVRTGYITAKAEKDDLYAAIDEVQDEVGRELRKVKRKRETLVRRGARRVKEILLGIRKPR